MIVRLAVSAEKFVCLCCVLAGTATAPSWIDAWAAVLGMHISTFDELPVLFCGR